MTSRKRSKGLVWPLQAVTLATVFCLNACGNAQPGTPSEPSEGVTSRATEVTPATKAKRVDERVPLPDWLPSDIYLPEDFEATQVLRLPNGLHLLRGISQASAEDLTGRYIQSLAEAGYEVVDRPEQQAKSVVQVRGKTLSDSIIRVKVAQVEAQTPVPIATVAVTQMSLRKRTHAAVMAAVSAESVRSTPPGSVAMAVLPTQTQQPTGVLVTSPQRLPHRAGVPAGDPHPARQARPRQRLSRATRGQERSPLMLAARVVRAGMACSKAARALKHPDQREEFLLAAGR